MFYQGRENKTENSLEKLNHVNNYLIWANNSYSLTYIYALYCTHLDVWRQNMCNTTASDTCYFFVWSLFCLLAASTWLLKLHGPLCSSFLRFHGRLSRSPSSFKDTLENRKIFLVTLLTFRQLSDFCDVYLKCVGGTHFV